MLHVFPYGGHAQKSHRWLSISVLSMRSIHLTLSQSERPYYFSVRFGGKQTGTRYRYVRLGVCTILPMNVLVEYQTQTRLFCLGRCFLKIGVGQSDAFWQLGDMIDGQICSSGCFERELVKVWVTMTALRRLPNATWWAEISGECYFTTIYTPKQKWKLFMNYEFCVDLK